MLIEMVRMAYFADEAPELRRAAELMDAVRLPADHPLLPMLTASSILARLQSGVSRRIRSHRFRPRCARSGPNSWE